MGWRLSGSTVDVEVDATFQAARVTVRPLQALGWQSIGLKSGLITGIAANGAIFSLRQIATTLLLIRRLGIGFTTTTAFTAAQAIEYNVTVARAFTTSDTGGTAISFTGNNLKHRTSLSTLTTVDCRISTTAALGAGTKVLDVNSLSIVPGFSNAVGAGINASANITNNLISQSTGDYPVVLIQNEGINILNVTAMGAAGVCTAYVNCELAEVSSY